MRKLITLTTCLFLSTAVAQSWQAVCTKSSNFSNTDFLVSQGEGNQTRYLGKFAFATQPKVTAADQSALTRLGALLQQANIQLVLVQIPSAAITYFTPNPASPASFTPSISRRAYTDWLQTVNAAKASNISTINLMPLIDQMEEKGASFFALRDHHWTDNAVLATGHLISKQITSLRLALDENAVTKLTRVPQVYEGTYTKTAQRVCGMPIITEPRDRFNLDISGGENLLGDANVDLVLTGDSYAIPNFGLPQVLSNDLRTPVVPAAINGGGPNSGFTAFLSTLKSDTKPKAIVWASRGLSLNEADIREYLGLLRTALFNPKRIATQITKAPAGATVNMTLTPTNTAVTVEVVVIGTKTEKLPMTLTYTDGSTEQREFTRVEQDIKQTYTTRFALDALKPLKAVSVSAPANTQVTINVYQQ